MIFNLIKFRAKYTYILLSIVFLSGCPTEEESKLVQQNIVTHQLNIFDIEISPSVDLVLKTQSPLQFKLNGLLKDGSTLMLESDATTAVDLASQATWTIDDKTIGEISSNGLFTSLDTSGSVTVTATFSNMQNSVTIVVTDSPLQSVEILPVTSLSVDVCKNIEFTARGTLVDGNIVPLSNDDLTWSTENNDIGTFKDDSVATLSTFLADDSLTITAKSIENEAIEGTADIAVLNTLVAVILTSENDTSDLRPGETLNFTLMGDYDEGTTEDITTNSEFGFELDETDIGEFSNNTLTINNDAPEGSVNVFGKCNRMERLFEVTVIAPAQ